MQGCSDVISVFCSLYISQHRLNVTSVLFGHLDVPALVFCISSSVWLARPVPSGGLHVKAALNSRWTNLPLHVFICFWPPAKCHSKLFDFAQFPCFSCLHAVSKDVAVIGQKKPRGKGKSAEYRLMVKGQ